MTNYFWLLKQKEKMPKIIHYRNKCIGCNSCVEHAPQNWKMSKEDGKSDLQHSTQKKDTWIIDISEDEVKKNKLAERDCPVKIIKVKP